MNRLILILILTFSFQPWTKADDIKDFQIEGMSIGDSLLDFMSEKEINNSKRNYVKNKKYYVHRINPHFRGGFVFLARCLTLYG